MVSSKPKPHWKLTSNHNEQRCMSCILLERYAFTLIHYSYVFSPTHRISVPVVCPGCDVKAQTLSEEAIFDVSFRPVRHRCYGPSSIVFRYDLIRILYPSGQDPRKQGADVVFWQEYGTGVDTGELESV